MITGVNYIVIIIMVSATHHNYAVGFLGDRSGTCRALQHNSVAQFVVLAVTQP
jgi:hypothetical protein